MIGFLRNLITHASTQLQWLRDSQATRTKLTRLISDMEDLSSRVLNPGAHHTTADMYAGEINDAIQILSHANTVLGLSQ